MKSTKKHSPLKHVPLGSRWFLPDPEKSTGTKTSKRKLKKKATSSKSSLPNINRHSSRESLGSKPISTADLKVSNSLASKILYEKNNTDKSLDRHRENSKRNHFVTNHILCETSRPKSCDSLRGDRQGDTISARSNKIVSYAPNEDVNFSEKMNVRSSSNLMNNAQNDQTNRYIGGKCSSSLNDEKYRSSLIGGTSNSLLNERKRSSSLMGEKSSSLIIGEKCRSPSTGSKCNSPECRGICSSPLNGGKCKSSSRIFRINSSPVNGGKTSMSLIGSKSSIPQTSQPDRGKSDNSCSNVPDVVHHIRRPRSSKTRKHPSSGLFRTYRPSSVIKTSPKKYTEYGPSTHKNRERPTLPKPYRDLYKYLQSCKFPWSSTTSSSTADSTTEFTANLRRSVDGSAVDPVALATKCHSNSDNIGSAVDPDSPAHALIASKSLHGSSVDPDNLSNSSHSLVDVVVEPKNQEVEQISKQSHKESANDFGDEKTEQIPSSVPEVPEIDPNIIEDDEEEAEEGKVSDPQDATSGNKQKSLSQSLQKRHLADMVELGKDVEPRDLTRALRDRGYFDYSYSYDKFSRTTTNNDHTKEGKKKPIERLHAMLGKHVPRLTSDLDSY